MVPMTGQRYVCFPEQPPHGGASEPGIFEKTRMCKFHVRGRCNRGKACTFAHGRAELHARPDLYRTTWCLDMLNTGRCPAGNRCKFAHTPEELRMPTSPSGAAGETEDFKCSPTSWSRQSTEDLFACGPPSWSPQTTEDLSCTASWSRLTTEDAHAELRLSEGSIGEGAAGAAAAIGVAIFVHSTFVTVAPVSAPAARRACSAPPRL